MIVEATHPAPVIFVPRRCRDERQLLVPVTTPVAVRRVPAAAMEPLARDPQWSGAPAAAFEDGLWSPVPGPRGPMTADALAAYLAGRLGCEGADAAFLGSPLLARLRHGPGPVPDAYLSVREAAPRDLDGARSVRIDRRAAAADALRRYLDTDLVVAGNIAWRRTRHLAILRPSTPSRLGFLGVGEAASLGSFATLLADPGGFDRMIAYARARHGGVTHSPEVAPWRAAPHGTGLAGEAGRVACDLLCEPVRELLLSASVHPDREREEGELRRLAEALEPAGLDATFGAAGGTDPRLLLQALAAAIETAAGGPSATPDWVVKESLHAAAAIRLLYLPGLLGPEPPAEDVEALGLAR